MINNKIKNLLWLMMIIAVSAGCRKLSTFKIKDSAEFVVPGTATAFIPVVSNMPVSSSASFQFENNGTDAKHVKEVKLDQLTLTIVQPSGTDFGFLNSIHIYISADGLPEIELAYLDNIPANAGSTLDLTTTGAVLDAYIKKNAYQLKIKTVTDEALSQDVTIRSDMTFSVRAKVL